ncbi:transcriptional regulator [Pseudomonas sp. Leaf127]|uniref:transcriptional regulator n=1 Tax=Pseudomonas sp. Leaf127 TaxID=1736267 RepID=UPI0012E73F0D|nr:transcriptional regulator [Pseudomonas sp. Leaf127]
MMKYDWDLIERLLHEVQNGAGETFTPRQYATEHAEAKMAQGEPPASLDELKAQAADLEALLVKRGYIEPRPQEEGGTGSNFILTPRGSSLLAMIDSSIPGNNHPRQVLDEQNGDPLEPVRFDHIAAKPQVA